MDSSAAATVHQISSSILNEVKPMQLPSDLNSSLALFARPVPNPTITPFFCADPSTMIALSQQLRSLLPSYPVVSLHAPIPITPTTPVSSSLPQKRPARVSSMSTSSTCSSSSVTSSSPQVSPLRKQAAPVPDEKKDHAYYERRRKNNDAAKRSRDARRQKEEAVAAKAAFLEQENFKLRSQVCLLESETKKLQALLVARLSSLDSEAKEPTEMITNEIQQSTEREDGKESKE